MRTIIAILLTATCLQAYADNIQPLLQRLDSYLGRRDHYMQAKQHRLDSLKALLARQDEAGQLRTLWTMGQEYFTYSYDSAIVYSQRQMQLAAKLHDEQALTIGRMHQSLLMATSGFYSQAEASMCAIDTTRLCKETRFYYNYTMTWLYNYWSSYCADEHFAPQLSDKRIAYLSRALSSLSAIMATDTIQAPATLPSSDASASYRLFSTPRETRAYYYYLLAEKIFLADANDKRSRKYYAMTLENAHINERVYACAAYGLARCYKQTGDTDKYLQFLVDAAISDIVCPLKENLALQELSMYLFNRDRDYAERAARYINYSMEDAQFYNNRLRIIEISKILPVISTAYQQKISRQEYAQRWVLLLVSLLALTLVLLLFYLRRQNSKLCLSRQEARKRMEEMEALNCQLEMTNRKRETYLRLFMDISAAYIHKLAEYRKLVSRKIKANQSADLLKQINSYRLAEEEATTFNTRFDKAFLELYPNFVSELNQLLTTDNQIHLPTATSLTTEVRIYALMRLGVTESQKIATLLFYSPQTVYNYKTAMRNKAKNRDTFEEDINHLCKIIV